MVRRETSAGVLALVGSAVACMQHVSLDARGPGPSLELSSQFVPMMKRQQGQQTVDVFFGPVNNVPAKMSACFAVNAQEQRKPRNAEQKKTINLQKGDSNLDLGVTVYFTEDGNQAIMYDTQPVAELASTCIGFMQEKGVKVNEIVLSHKHQDHVGGLASNQLNQIKVLAQDNTKKDLAQGGGRVPDETYTDFKTLSLGGTDINVTHFDAHTDDGSGLFINNAMVLMGDECEDNVPFIAEPERVQSQMRNLNQRINEIEAQNIKTVCPAHGDGTTIFDGCFTLDLCKSNLAYLNIMTTDLQNACDFAGNQNGGGRQGGNNQQEAQAFAKLQDLAPQFNRQPEDIREAYGAAHLSNCKSLAQAQGRQGGGAGRGAQSQQGGGGGGGGGGGRGGKKNKKKNN